MPDSSIAITAGTGTSIDTRTEATNSEHRQVVIIGDPSTNAGVAPVDATNGLAVDIKTISGGNLPNTLVDDAAFTPATSRVLPIAAEFDDTAPDSVDEGDAGAVRMSANRNLYIRIRDNAGNERGANIDANGNLNTILPSTSIGGATAKTADLDSGAGTDTVAVQGIAVAAAGGAAVITGDTTNGLDVDVTRVSGNVTVVQTTASSLNAQVVGEVAHDGVDSGNPQKIGGIALGSQQAAVAASDRTNAAFDRHGNLYIRAGNQAPSGSIWTGIHLPAANTAATVTKAAAGVGVRNVCTSITAVIVATATAPTAVQLNVSLIDGGTGGTTYLWRSVLSLPATAGETRGITLPCWLPGTANTAMTLEFSAAGGANTVESVSMAGVLITE